MTQLKKILAGEVSHIKTKQFRDLDHAAIAYMLGMDKTIPAVLARLKILNKQDTKAMKSFIKQFNVKDLKGLAGELIEYYQNHPEKIDRFKGASKHDPKIPAKDYGKNK